MRAQDKGPKIGSLLSQTQKVLHSFIRTSFHSQDSVNTSYTQDIFYDSHWVQCATTKNDLVLLHKYSSPLDYPTQTALISFILQCTLNEVGLILSLGNLRLTNIYHVRIMKSSVHPKLKRGGITCQSETKTCKRVQGIEPCLIPMLVEQAQRLGDIRRPIPIWTDSLIS